jgi:hypothetical protein
MRRSRSQRFFGRCGQFLMLKNADPPQGCQMVMVYFQTENPTLGKLCRFMQWKMLVYFMAIWYILWPFGIFYSTLVYVTANWYILWPIGIFYGNLVYFMASFPVGN